MLEAIFCATKRKKVVPILGINFNSLLLVSVGWLI